MRLDLTGAIPPRRERVSQVTSTAIGAFTLLELMAVVCILAIFAVIFVPDMSRLLERAGEARCAANMRNITVALHAYLPDHGQVWPQGPTPEAGAAWEDFWLATLEPYGINSSTWKCPTIASKSGADGSRVHYTPTMFPPTPNIANRWATQPWLLERANAHGHGALICFPDGSVKSFDKVLAELGVQ